MKGKHLIKLFTYKKEKETSNDLKLIENRKG